MDSVALALFRFFSRTRQQAGAAVRAPGAAPHPHPHPHECNYDAMSRATIDCAHAKCTIFVTYVSYDACAIMCALLLDLIVIDATGYFVALHSGL